MPVPNLTSFVVVDAEVLILGSDPGCLTPGTCKHCVPPCSCSLCTSSWVVTAAGALHRGCSARRSGSRNLPFCSPGLLDWKARPRWTRWCSPLRPHQIWVICSHSLETFFSSRQGPARAAMAPVGTPHHTQHPGAWATWGRESAPSHTELNSRAARLPAAQPLSNKVKLV